MFHIPPPPPAPLKLLHKPPSPTHRAEGYQNHAANRYMSDDKTGSMPSSIRAACDVDSSALYKTHLLNGVGTKSISTNLTNKSLSAVIDNQSIATKGGGVGHKGGIGILFRLSLLTNSALVYESKKCGGRGELQGLSQ
jgi:hypothetical protein